MLLQLLPILVGCPSSVTSPPTRVSPHHRISWSPPPVCTIKINMHGSFIVDHTQRGIGWIFWNNHENPLLYFGKQIIIELAIYVEILALKRASRWLPHLNGKTLLSSFLNLTHPMASYGSPIHPKHCGNSWTLLEIFYLHSAVTYSSPLPTFTISEMRSLKFSLECEPQDLILLSSFNYFIFNFVFHVFMTPIILWSILLNKFLKYNNIKGRSRKETSDTCGPLLIDVVFNGVFLPSMSFGYTLLKPCMCFSSIANFVYPCTYVI